MNTAVLAAAPKAIEVGGNAADDTAGRRYAAWFHELDAWTEYWDIYHPESRGRYYFGDEQGEAGLLTLLLPRDQRPPALAAWVRMATEASESTAAATRSAFVTLVTQPAVAAAVSEVDALLARLFRSHFGDARRPAVQRDYIAALFRFGADTLPPAAERDARIAADDPRKPTAGRHTLEGDLMWFAWALQIEAAMAVAGRGSDTHADAQSNARRALSLAGVAVGCAANFAWRGHRRTRPEYGADPNTEKRLHERGLAWGADPVAAAAEVHALYRIREWGSEA